MGTGFLLFLIFWCILSVAWPFIYNPSKNLKEGEYKTSIFGRKYYKSELKRSMWWGRFWTIVWILIIIGYCSEI